MKQLTYDYVDILELKTYCDRTFTDAHKLIVQIHTDSNALADKISTILTHLNCELQILPVIEQGVATRLYISVYTPQAIITTNEEFLDHDLYKAIIDSTREGFWLLDENLNIIGVNNAFGQMLEYSETELIGKKPYELFALVNEQQSFCEEQASSAHTSEQRSYELTFVSKTGKEIHTIVNATTLEVPVGLLRTFAFITDISEQKRLEQTLITQQYNINELNTDLAQRVEAEVIANRKKDHIMYQQARLASMGEMIANIAHQWRQPLNIIALIMQEFYISGQLGTLDREKIEKEYARANSVLQYMSNTIDDFRTFFKHNDEGELFEIKTAIDSVLTLISKTMEHNHITINVEIEDDLKVFGHKNEFVQALINLLNNAREAIMSQELESGYINITARSDGEMIHVRVQDNGGGIAVDDIEQIFEPYFTTKHQTQGTGLGLYMTHQIIVNNMNGSIHAENSGDGTCFCMELPQKMIEETKS